MRLLVRSFVHRHCIRRNLSILPKDGPVRVRFAPSPTGELHLGGYRTALYNYLFARKHGGRMILRIEDTDQSRKVEGAEERLIDTLRWGGIRPDEGPGDIGGEFGPYRQSERLELYRSAAEALMESGAAYRCFCSEKRLDLLRRDAARRRMPNRYDRRCLPISKEESKERADAGEPHVIRLLMPDEDEPEPFDDLVFGPDSCPHDVAATEGDPIILKSDGFPTYHLANVVDDHRMEVTHVLRGSEWLLSTQKHLRLYRALGWRPPRFAHLPLLLGADGAKLSKRNRDANADALRRAGFDPEAVINYATMAGGGFADRERERVYSLGELAERFSLGHVSRHPARVEPESLRTLSRNLLKSKMESDMPNLVRKARKILGDSPVTDEYVEKVILWSQDRIFTLSDLFSEDFKYLWKAPTMVSLPDQVGSEVLSRLEQRLEQELDEDPDSQESIKILKKFSKEEGIKFALMMKALRQSLVGSEEGPPVGELFQTLGKEVVVGRVRNAAKLSSFSANKELVI